VGIGLGRQAKSSRGGGCKMGLGKLVDGWKGLVLWKGKMLTQLESIQYRIAINLGGRD